MTVVGGPKKKKDTELKPVNEVPDDHPIIRGFPRELGTDIRLRLEDIRITHAFVACTDQVATTIAETMDSISTFLGGKPKAQPERPPPRRWFEMQSSIKTEWSLWIGEKNHHVEVFGESEIDEAIFKLDGSIADPAKWSALVKEHIDSVLLERDLRVAELLRAGLEAEKEAASE